LATAAACLSAAFARAASILSAIAALAASALVSDSVPAFVAAEFKPALASSILTTAESFFAAIDFFTKFAHLLD